MPELGSPQVRRRRLAVELRRLREERGLRGEDVAESLGWSSSKLSRIETARIGIKADDLDRLLRHYDLPADYRQELLTLASESRNRGWWSAYADAVPEKFATYLVMETEAVSISGWSPDLVPGLLQTEEYARATIDAHMAATAPLSPGEVERRVQARLRRQQILTSESPKRFACVLDESVLLRRETSARVMRDQLGNLIAMSALANVTLHVLPLDGAHPIGTGAFMLFQFAPIPGIGAVSDIVYIEQLTGSALYIDDDAETYQYRRGFSQLVAESLDPATSVGLIERIMQDTWSR